MFNQVVSLDPQQTVAVAAIGKEYSGPLGEEEGYAKFKRDTLTGLRFCARLKLELGQSLDKHKDRGDALAEAAHDAEANELQEALAAANDERNKSQAAMNSLLAGAPYNNLHVPHKNKDAYNEAEQNFKRATVERNSLQHQIAELGNKRKAAQDRSKRTKRSRVDLLGRAQVVCDEAMETLL